MPLYEFRCRICHHRIFRQEREPPPSPIHCGVPARRIWGFALSKGDLEWEPHRSTATGTVVRSRAHFRDELKRVADERTARTGIPHDYQPIDARDLPLDHVGMRETYDQAVREGRPPPPLPKD